MSLPEPTIDYVRERIAQFDRDDRYFGAEQAVSLVFDQWPLNNDYSEVLIKTTVLNRLYSTNIYDIWTVAQHIKNLRIDARLDHGEPAALVHDIALVPKGDKRRFLFSFATKYCSWHRPERFQIYDGYVDWLLWEYKRQFRFARFYRYELRDYARFAEVIEQFRDRFDLHSLTAKQMDKYLWIEGMEHWK